MERIIDYKWFLPKDICTKRALDKAGWKYSHAMSSKDSYSGDVYTYRFKAYSYGSTMVLEGYFWIEMDTGEVHIDVKDKYSNATYAPFYYYEFGNYTPLLNQVNEKINKEINKLGIKRGKKK